MRQHPAWILLSALRQLRGLALPFAVLLISGGRREEEWILVVSGLLTAIGVIVRTVAWWQFRYEVAEGELRVRSGLLARRERFVPLERIQAVDVSEAPLQRLFGVVGVRIETAAGGSADADVRLEAVSRAEAERLRDRLAVARRTGGLPTPGATDASSAGPVLASHRPRTIDGEGQLIRKLTAGELLTVGATSGRIGPALAVLSFAFQVVDDLVPDEFWERIAMNPPGWSLRGLITITVVVGLGAWLLAIASTVLTFGGFELRREGDRLLVAHGLLERRRRSIPLARVQAVAISEGLLRQPFGLAAVRFESAGYGKDTAESGILFPLLRRAEVPALLAATCPSFAAPLDPPDLAGPPRRARRRYVLAGIWPLLGLTAVAVGVAAVAPWLGWRWGLVPLALAPLAALHGQRRFRDAGWAIAPPELLVVRAGGLERVTTIIPRRRLQRRSLSQDVLQRRARLASFEAAVASGGAGGRVRLDHLDEAAAFDLLDRLGTGRPAAPVPALPIRLTVAASEPASGT